MKYTFLLHDSEEGIADVSEADIEREMAAYGAYTQALQKAGVYVDADWLQPSHSGTVISLKSGKRHVQDGPFADTKEQLGGYFVVDVPDLDVALDWAEKCPAAKTGYVEIRPSAMPEGQL